MHKRLTLIWVMAIKLGGWKLLARYWQYTEKLRLVGMMLQGWLGWWVGRGNKNGYGFEGCGIEAWDGVIRSLGKVLLAWVGPWCLISGWMLLRYT